MARNSKKILITGASSGFGELTAIKLLEREHQVIVTARDARTRIPKRVKRFVGTGRLLMADLHLEDTRSFENVAQLVEGRWGGELDVLINNAGYGILGSLPVITEAELRKQMEVNFFGTVGLTQRLLPCLIRSKGRVLVLSSIAGLTSFPFYGAYNASKFALEGYFGALRADLIPYGVQVGLIEPGGFKTKFKSNAILCERHDQADPVVNQAWKGFVDFLNQRADRWMGNPETVAKLLVRLSERRRVPFRKLVGIDARSLFLLCKILPENLRDILIQFFFKKAFFRS